MTASAILKELKRSGLLLKQDKHIPNVVSYVTDETLSGSWWAHSQAYEIYRVLGKLTAHPDVAIAKLLAGKDTLVHRALWPALAGVGSERARWQMDRLSAAARTLFRRVQQDGVAQASGRPAKELALRLLVFAEQVHTPRGHHEIRLESWEHWMQRVRCRKLLPGDEGRHTLERAATALGAAPKLLPWRQHLA